MAGEPDDVDAMVDLQADLKAPLPLADAAFDRVLCHNVLECLPDPGALVAEAVRVLRRHGRLVLAHSDFDTLLFASEDLELTRVPAGRRLGAEGGALLWLQGTGAFAAPFASGPLLVVAPAGAGVREAALLLLGSSVTAPVAAVIAVVSRLLFILGDLAWSGVAMLAARRLLRPPGPPPPG
jgi:SAM-dependent methyltransferase